MNEFYKRICEGDFDDNLDWLLPKIKILIEDNLWRIKNGFPPHPVTVQSIFRGSYDVWENESDALMGTKYMLHQITNARKEGYITNETGNDIWKFKEPWLLTEKGEEYLNEKGDNHEENRKW